jgi:predicted SAM-dependent methyltransferase
MNIEFGSGETPTKDGYNTSDIRNLPGVTFVCSAWDIDQHVQPNTVDNIFSRHFFEHLTFAQGELVLQKWKTILKPTGTIEMLLPNMSFHIRQWNKRKNEKNKNHARAGFWGWQRGEFEDTWDTHKSGYDNEFFEELLLRYNFIDIVSHEPITSKHLHYTFKKSKII